MYVNLIGVGGKKHCLIHRIKRNFPDTLMCQKIRYPRRDLNPVALGHKPHVLSFSVTCLWFIFWRPLSNHKCDLSVKQMLKINIIRQNVPPKAWKIKDNMGNYKAYLCTNYRWRKLSCLTCQELCIFNRLLSFFSNRSVNVKRVQATCVILKTNLTIPFYISSAISILNNH